ncbi:DUF2164 family protein [Aquibacillus halophilus]|uniref:DUF2164 family protein n=1 Tax=Aquibacillus halophilus TaxID=930132 RepID=A0A6A8DG26_9BACI|nr:DUF2164 domain-containing protein [Aquibacillus halophilus]MRH44603.1 DUF2164 family protein [Aquibacillus halophilus]
MNQKFNLKSVDKEAMIESIKEYFKRERNEELGDLAASLILDFFTEELAPLFYNIGIEDAHTYINSKLEEIFELQK